MLTRCRFQGLLVLGLAVCGCQEGVPPAANHPPAKAATTDVEHDEKPTAPPVTPLVAAAPDSPPVAAVRAVLKDVDAGKLEALADFLPASFQRDLETLLRRLAEKTPDDLWAQLHQVASKAAALVQEDPQLVAQSVGATVPTNDEEFQSRLSAAIAPLTNLETWERSRWESFEFKSFLQGPASAMLAAWQTVAPAPAGMSSQTSIRLLTLDGDRATLEFRSAVDPEPRSVEFVRVEEKWIPKSLAESWPATMQRALSQLSEVTSEQSASVAGRVTPLLLQIAGILDQMRAADRAEELQLGWWQIQSLLVQSRQDWLEPGPPPRVELRVVGELSEEELTKLLDQLVEALDQPELAEYVTFPTTTGTVIHLSPIPDLKSFVGKLTFVTVKSHNAEQRSVEIERK